MNCMRKKNHCTLNLLLMVLGNVCISECVASSAVHEVFNFIFSNNSYNKDIRPVKQWMTPTIVDVTVSIIAIVDYNEVQQMIKLATKLTLNWKDEYLVWDPTLYENVSHIHAPQSMIWMPAIILENSVAKHLEFGTSTLKVTINHDGTVQWDPIEVFHSTCAADVRKFPFDTQTCEIVFESMIYSVDEVKLHATHDHLEFHQYGGISGWTATETHVKVEIGESRKTHLICSLTMTRHPTYFILNIFLPIVLLTFMNICVFILPVQSGEKASFVITVFLSLAVFLTIVSSKLPENSDTVSLLNVYVFISTLLSVIIAISTIIQIRIFHKDYDTPVPNFLKHIVAWFTSNAKLRRSLRKNTNQQADIQKRGELDVLPAHSVNEGRLRNKGTTYTEEQTVSITWSDVVMALDNFFLLLFLIINISMTVVIFSLAIRHEDHEEVGEKHHH